MDHSHSPHDRKRLLNRLAKIEGHTRAIVEMIHDNRDCPELLHQIRSIVGAWQRLGEQILDEHLKSCVREAVTSGRADEAIDNVREALLGRISFDRR